MKPDYDFFEEDAQQEQEVLQPEFGCGFCWNMKRQKNKELFFLDSANNMRLCTYCPNCGRKL